MKVGTNGETLPDYNSCKTKVEIEQEYIKWANYMSISWYQIDNPGISEKDAKIKIQGLLDAGKYSSFHSDTDENGTRWYYTGGKSDRKSTIKTQHSAMNTAKRKMVASGVTSDITKCIEYTITGTKVYMKDQRTELQQLSDAVKSGTLTGQTKEEAINNINTKYGIKLKTDASWQDIKSEVNKTIGGIVNEVKNSWSTVETGIKSDGNGVISWFAHETDPETGKKKPSKIEQTISDINRQTLGSVSTVWDNSKDETIVKFREKGITGDVMWGVLTGKYNTDDKCRKDLKNLAADIQNEALTDEERKTKIRALNEKYGLNIDENASPQDLTDVINSQDKYSYKKIVRDVAGRIIYDKVNENLNTQLEQRFGKTLSKFGITFSFKDRDTIADLKAIIRGQKMIYWDKDKVLKGLQDQLEKKIGKFIDEKVNQALDKAASNLQKKMDTAADKINKALTDNSVYRAVDSWNTQLTTWTSNPDTLKLEIANKLDSAISNPMNAIESKLNNIPVLNKLGINLGTMVKDITGTYTKGFAEKINNVVQPLLKKALAVTTKIKEAVKKLQERITELKNKAKALVEKWKNTVKDMVAKQTKKLVNELVKYVKVNVFSGLSSSFKI